MLANGFSRLAPSLSGASAHLPPLLQSGGCAAGAAGGGTQEPPAAQQAQSGTGQASGGHLELAKAPPG